MNNEFIDEYDYEIVRNKLINSYKKEGLELGRTEGKIEGEKSKQLEIAERMLNDKVNLETISKYTGLSIDEIDDLKVWFTILFFIIKSRLLYSLLYIIIAEKQYICSSPEMANAT